MGIDILKKNLAKFKFIFFLLIFLLPLFSYANDGSIDKNKLQLYNNDIFNYNFKNNKFDLLIINDPFINYDDYKKLLKKLINCDYKNYLVLLVISIRRSKNIIIYLTKFFFLFQRYT